MSVLASRSQMGALRAGFAWDAGRGTFTADPLLAAVEPPVAGVPTSLPCVRRQLLPFVPLRPPARRAVCTL